MDLGHHEECEANLSSHRKPLPWERILCVSAGDPRLKGK
jgi:hypothetical protein